MEERNLKDKVAKGIFWGGLSNGIQQLLGVFFGIFTARILSNEDYGLVGMITVFTVVASSLQDSGFKIALINRRNATNLDYSSVFWFGMMISVTLYTMLFFAAPLIAAFYGEPKLVTLSRVTFLCIPIACLGNVQGAIINKELKVKEMAIASMSAIGCAGIVGLAFAINGFAYWSIAAQNIAFMSTHVGLMWYFSTWRPSLRFSFAPIREMFSFSSKILFTNIINQVNNNIFNVILGKYYNQACVGNYTQANKWNNFGTNFINGMMSGVEQPVFAKLDNDNERKCRVFRKMLRFTCFVSFPAMFGLAFISEDFIITVLGQKWADSASLMSILCIGGAFVPITSLYANMTLSQGKSNVMMYNTLLICIAQLSSAIAIASIFKGTEAIRIMVTAYITINTLWLFVWHWRLKKLIGISLRSCIKDVTPFATIVAAIIALVWFMTSWIDYSIVRMCLRIVLVGAFYIGIMKLSNAVVYNDVVNFILKKKRQ